MSETFRAPEVTRIRHNRWWLAFGASPFALGLVFVIAALVTGQPALLLPLIHTTLFGALGVGWAYNKNKSPVHLAGGLVIDELGVHHQGSPSVPRGELVRGVVVDVGASTHVRLHRRGLRPPLVFEVRDHDEGRAVLRALGFDASQSAAEMRAASGVFSWSVWRQMLVFVMPVLFVFLPAMTLGTSSGSPLPVLLGVPLLLAYVFTLIFSPTRVRVGADGVFKRWLWREDFVPFSRVRSVQAYREEVLNKVYDGVALTLDDGRVERIPCGQEGWSVVAKDEILARVTEAFALSREEPGAPLDPALLARGGRAAPEWLRSLRRLGAGANATMRSAPVSVERLLALVDDPAAPAAARVGAAVAALASEPEETRRRVRVAVQKAASPPLRVALDQVAEGADDEVLAATLAELEADAQAEPRADAEVTGPSRSRAP